jgi:putative hemolysin
MRAVIIIVGLMLITACSDKTGLPNPASVHCEEQGGILEIRTVNGGQAGFCKLPDGTVCEEWAYYRGECPEGQEDPKQKAIEAAKAHAKTLKQWIEGADIEISRVTEADCVGCYTVQMEFDVPKKDNPNMTERVSVSVDMDNWVVSDVGTETVDTELSPEECEDRGGTPLNTVAGDTCKPEETNLGKVVGFISPNICCALITDFDACVKAGFPIMESYPRQCAVPGKETFVEVLEPDIAEILEDDCTTVEDCTLPGEWAMRSICPYEVRCIEARCTVVCPWPGQHPG